MTRNRTSAYGVSVEQLNDAPVAITQGVGAQSNQGTGDSTGFQAPQVLRVLTRGEGPKESGLMCDTAGRVKDIFTENSFRWWPNSMRGSRGTQGLKRSTGITLPRDKHATLYAAAERLAVFSRYPFSVLLYPS